MVNFSTKMTSVVSTVALLATTMSASLVSAASEFLPYAEALADNDIIGAQSTEAGYRLGDTVTRAELAKVTANLGGYTPTSCAGDVYSDVKSSLGDLCGYIEALAEAGVVSTSYANFRPSASVTRAEMVKMLLGAVGETPSTTSAGYMDVANLGDLTGYINRANELGCAADATYFRPNATSSRGEAFKIAACVAGLEIGGNTGSGTTGTGTNNSGSVSSGSLTVVLSGTPAAQYVPKNASSVKVGTVKLTAGSNGNVTVNSLTINRSGLGDSLGLTVAVGQNGVSISESRTVNTATQDAIVRLNNPLVINAGTSVELDVLASFDSSSKENNQHQFNLKAVGTASSVTGLPITLGLLNTTSYSVSETKVTGLDFGAVTSGKNDQSLGTVKIQAGNKDITLSAFTLSKTSGVDMTKAFANAAVLKNGVKVGTASVTTDKIYVKGLNTKIARNDTATFEIRADVTYVGAGGAADDITLDIVDTTDVMATEDLTGYATSTNLVGANADTVVLSSLDIVWTKNSTKSITVAPGTTNVVLFDARAVSSASFDVTSFTLDGVATTANSLTDTGELAQFTSLTLTVNGVDYDLLNTTQTAVGQYTFAATADKFRMDPGAAVNVKLVGNLSNSAGTGTYSYNVNLNTVKNVATGNSVNLSGKNITGDTVTVQTPELILKKATVAAPTSTKIYGNATALEIGRFGLEAKAEEVTVRELTITNNTGALANEITDFTKLISGTNVKLVNTADNTQISASVTVNATEIKFTGMTVRIPKDTTTNLKLLVDTQGDLVTALGSANQFNAVVDIVSTSVSSSSTVTLTGDNAAPDASKVYTAGVVPPTITLVKTAPNIFKVTISNVDADNSINVTGLDAQVRPVADNNSSYTATICVRDEGSTLKCNDSGITSGTGAVPGAAKAFTLSETISKNSSITKEIYVDSNFVNPPTLQAEVSKVNYDSTSETYSVVAQ